MTMNPDIEHAPQIPLLNPPSSLTRESGRRLQKGTLIFILSILFLMSLVALMINLKSHTGPLEKHQNNNNTVKPFSAETKSVPLLRPRGVDEGVSPKSNPYLLQTASYNWTNAMLSWQRTSFHFQPEKNWMNGTSTSTFVTSNYIPNY